MLKIAIVFADRKFLLLFVVCKREKREGVYSINDVKEVQNLYHMDVGSTNDVFKNNVNRDGCIRRSCRI